MQTLVKSATQLVESPRYVRIEQLRPRSGLLRDGAQQGKRCFDIVFALLLAAAALPLCLLIAAAIVLESRGPVFFAHTRIGKGNRRFRLWKFRSMVADGDEVLAGYLNKHPELAREWNETHKLKNDPRVTRVGRILRRTSLDELPQLCNVLRGDMSMIGPRPIVEDEIPKYRAAFPLYLKVSPGLTGLWQVSGRNDTSYNQRLELDTEYIRNWTPAMDAVVLLKTVKVVVGGRGAY